MRRKPVRNLLPSAHAVDREFKVISALNTTGFPVPRAYALCSDEAVISSMFYVMEMVEGRILWVLSLPACAPRERHAIHMAALRTLADLHTTDYQAIGLADFAACPVALARTPSPKLRAVSTALTTSVAEDAITV